jgi:hypothetical protein
MHKNCIILHNKFTHLSIIWVPFKMQPLPWWDSQTAIRKLPRSIGFLEHEDLFGIYLCIRSMLEYQHETYRPFG